MIKHIPQDKKRAGRMSLSRSGMKQAGSGVAGVAAGRLIASTILVTATLHGALRPSCKNIGVYCY
jgi:DNA-binding transcriptional regulator YdaS (Cro superfamily)